jgi:UDP-N-acetylmuramoyl-tripeptide--D-alanyl-D-alanine ligase
MGARGEGHLTYLCDIAPPDVALVLNVGKAHLGEFGSQDRIARAKGELVAVLGPDGVAVLNADDVLVLAMAERTAGRVVTFGESPAADVRLENLAVDSLGRPRFDLAFTAPGATGQAIQGVSQHVELPLVGEHQAGNAAAAAAVAAAVGISPPEIADALRRVRLQSRWRMELHELPTGVTVINDAYNASPDSMRAALKTLAAIGRGRSPRARTVAVLGEMRELGEAGREEHDAVGRLAVRLDISQLLVVGEPAHALHLGASLEGSWDEESVFVPDTDEALRWLRANLVPGDVVLVKASRAAGLERVAEALVTEAAQTPVEPPR